MCSNIIKDTNYLSTCPSVYLSVSLSLSFSLIVYLHNNDIFFKHFQNSQQVMCLSPTKTRMPKKHGISRDRIRPFSHTTGAFWEPGADGLFFLGSGITPIVTLHRPADESWIVCNTRGNWENIAELSVSSSWMLDTWYIGHFWYSGGMSWSYKRNFYCILIVFRAASAWFCLKLHRYMVMKTDIDGWKAHAWMV